MSGRLRVVFMGCPEFAVPSLKALQQDDDFDVVAVYCMPDRPKGRGKKAAMTPVKSCALKYGIEVNTPSSFKKFPKEVDRIASYKPDFLVVVAYGLILPDQVLEIPKIAAINVHASLLPEYRGPAPIHHALLNGDKVTGNSIMLMNSKMDEGDVLAASRVVIDEDDNLETLHDKLCADGSKLLIPTLKDFAAGKIVPVKQDHSQATYTGKITPQLAKLDWRKSSVEVCNLVRAMSPFPGSWFLDGDTRIKVFSASLGDTVDATPGTILIDKEALQVVCGDRKSIFLNELQRPGKTKVKTAEFLRGYSFKNKIML